MTQEMNIDIVHQKYKHLFIILLEPFLTEILHLFF